MPDDGVPTTDRSAGPAELDQVDVAREWLRRQGVDLGAVPQAGREMHREGGLALDEAPGRRRAPTSSSRPSGQARAGRRGGRRSRDPEGESDIDPDGPSANDPASGAAEEPDADPEDVARQIVLRKLAASARTRAELERALRARAVPEEAAAVVLDRMAEVGLIDDAAFARDWVASRQQRRHLSRTALRRELQTKGVDRDVVDDALADVAGADEHRAALDLAHRRASSLRGLPREVAYRRLGGVLGRRGFSSSITTRVLAEVLGDWSAD